MQNNSFRRRLVQGTKNQFIFAGKAFLDPLFYMLLSAGLGGWFMGRPDVHFTWDRLLVKAFIEEFFFRFLLLEALLRIIPQRLKLGPVSLANVLVSGCFCAMHMLTQSFFWAAMTFFPSLLFGFAWERYRSLIPVTLIHFSYNFLLFYSIFKHGS